MNIEDKIGKKIVSYLDDEVSPDISARLEFARNNALKKIKRTKVPWYKNISLPRLPQLAGRMVLATLTLILLSSSNYMLQDNDEISYHVEADRLPSYIIDEI